MYFYLAVLILICLPFVIAGKTILGYMATRQKERDKYEYALTLYKSGDYLVAESVLDSCKYPGAEELRKAAHSQYLVQKQQR